MAPTPPQKENTITTNEIPRPIAEFIDATTRADSDAFVRTFTEDALLDDWGRQYHAHDGIRDWNSTDNIGVQTRIALTALKPGTDPSSYIGIVAVSGNGFNGTGTMTFTLRDDLIASLLIG